jgi:drug/metabolite transporter (DMT)-like permease
MKVAEAASVAPFEYIRLIFATLIGIIIFSEIPTIWTVTGSAIIIGSTLYTLKRNALRK